MASIFCFQSNISNTVIDRLPPCISDESSPPPAERLDSKVVIRRLPGNSRGSKFATQKLVEPLVFTRELIAALHGQPLPRAASTVGISTTAFKKACRRLGVARWDYKRGRGRRQQSDCGVAIADAGAIPQEGPKPLPCRSNMTLLGSRRDSPPRRHAITPALLDIKPLLPERSGAISFAESRSGSSELQAGLRQGISAIPLASPPAPPQPASLELGWPLLGGETTEGWADGEVGWGVGLGAADDALVLMMLAYPWPEKASLICP
jgi:hypothetical protein